MEHNKKKAVSHNNTKQKNNSRAKKKTVSKKTAGKEQISKNLWRNLVIGFGAAAIVYMLAAVFFSSHFFLRTEINGYSCQFKTVEQVKEMIRKGCEDFELTLKEREDKAEVITSKQVALEFVDDGKIEAIKENQKGYAWITSIFKKAVYENAATITLNENALLETVDKLEALKPENRKVPIAAYPAYNSEAGKFEIIKEDLGTDVDKDKLLGAVKEALLSDQRVLNLHEAECYVKPKFYSEDDAVIKARDLMNHYLKTELTHDFGFTKVALNAEEISKWLSVDEQSQVVIDQSKAGDYVQWLGTNYNTCGIRRKFKTPENTTITISGGTYGWRIDHKKEVAKLCEDIQTGKPITREPVYRQTGYQRDENGNDLHDTYIAISIQAQTMWYYKNGKCLLSTPVVTGNTSKKMGTPTGVYEIAFKQRDHVLRGEDYESPVDYWMPFYEYRGIGIHDASWRAADAFGAEIYKTNGSHGCVNTPYNAVKSLYGMVSAGTPVVVY